MNKKKAKKTKGKGKKSTALATTSPEEKSIILGLRRQIESMEARMVELIRRTQPPVRTLAMADGKTYRLREVQDPMLSDRPYVLDRRGYERDEAYGGDYDHDPYDPDLVHSIADDEDGSKFG